MIKVRPFESYDLESLTALMTDLGYPSSIEEMEERMKKIQSQSNCFTFVATINEKVVGMIGVRQNFTYTTNRIITQISALVTKKEYQGQGIGKELIKFIEEWTGSNESDFLYLTSAIKEERINAHEFYKKNGFEVTGYRFVKRIET